MKTDSNMHRGHAGFPVDQPIEALKMDHTFVRQLFDRYLNTQDIDVKRQVGPQILTMLEMHSALEEAVFYPRVQDADATLMENCQDDHRQVDEMIRQLKGMEEGDPQCEQLFHDLRDAVMRHVEIEEQQLFPKVEQANLDLSAIGLEMQAFEANVVSRQARAPAPRRRAALKTAV